ncbi:MAG: hypothetical protein JHC33_13840 [Ignisphaera sp.]|nr:hypothetical protein [Ignisphaera sp.]
MASNPFDSAMWYIVLRVWDERDANKALELMNKIYDLWWDINSLLAGRRIAQDIASGKQVAPGDVKIWQQVYKSMTPQQIDERIQQEYKELQDAENQLRQILAKYGASQQEIDTVIKNIKVSIPFKYSNAEQVLAQILGKQTQSQQQSSQGSSQQSVSTAVVSVSTQAQQQQAQQKQAQQSQQQQGQGNQQSTGSTSKQ